jgi:hypothetical protein
MEPDLADIEIEGQYLFTVRGNTPAGRQWLQFGIIDLESTKVAQVLIDRAFADGLTVDVNGRRYLGFGMCAVKPQKI